MRGDRGAAAARYLTAVLLTVILIPLTGSGWVWCILALELLLPPVSACCSLYVARHLEGQIRLPTTASKEKRNEGTVVLKNNGLLPAVKLECVVGIVNDLTREESSLSFSSAVGSGQEREHPFYLESTRCGRLYVHICSVRILDWFGLIPVNAAVTGSARMTVLPELFACDLELAPVSAASDDGNADRRGDDRTEVYQLREYREGDDVRQIHWKLSSKLDTLILREPGQSISRSVLVFWDKRQECAPEIMDALAEITASVCQTLADRGIPFDLGWTEGEEPELRQIADTDTILQTIPALVTKMGHPDCVVPDMEEYGRVIWISSGLPETEPQEKMFCLICAEEGREERQVLAVTPEDYKERLERLEI